jgi:hypothetical protein
MIDILKPESKLSDLGIDPKLPIFAPYYQVEHLK